MQTSLKLIIAFIFVSLLGAGGLNFVANANTTLPESYEIAQAVEDDDAGEDSEDEDGEDEDEDDEDEDDDDEEGEDEDEDEQALLDGATVTPTEAEQIAMANVQGAVEEVELDLEAGQLVYEVEIGGQEVMIDALSGAVLSTEIDD